MKHKKEIILVLIGVILILAGAYLTASTALTTRKNADKTVENKKSKEELKVNGELIKLKLYRVDKAFFLKVPDSFVAVTGDALNQKYGTSERPELIFESKDDSTHISVTKGKEAMTDDMLNNYVNTIKAGLTGFTDVKMQTYQKYNKNFVRITATSTDEAAKYYDIRYFTLEDKLVTVEFYTTINQKNDWEKVSKKVLDTICFDEEDSKDITN